ncbi:hypothetical protein JXQ70_04920 [bacterium]|nr:hypothetical protein [bacterium]
MITLKVHAMSARTTFIYCALLVSIVLVLFSGVLTADFVMWDDDIFIYQNPKLALSGWKRIVWAFTDVELMMRYNPLTLISWSLSYQIFGLNPFGYHLVNWLLHGFSSGLLFLIIRKILLLSIIKLGRSDRVELDWINPAAFLATLIWAVHPLRVEPVAWATDRTYCQALFFMFLATLCYLRAGQADNRSKHYYSCFLLSFSCYCCSILSYSIGMLYFLILCVIDIFLFQRIGGRIGWWRSTEAKKVILEKLIFALPAVIIGLVTILVRIQSAGVFDPPVSLAKFGLLPRFMQAMYIFSYYIWRPFVPVNLAPAYVTLVSFKPLTMPFILSAGGIIALVCTLFLLRKRWPLGLALILVYIITLIPVTGFFEYPHHHSDRYSLIATIPLSLLIAFGLMEIKKKAARRMSVIFLVLIIGMLSWLTYQQIKVWHNTENLFGHMLKTMGDNSYRYGIHFKLGKYLYINGRTEEALSHFNQTVLIHPKYPPVHLYLADIEQKKNNLEKAVYHLQIVIAKEPHNFRAHYKLASVYAQMQRMPEAAHHFHLAVSLEQKDRNRR